MGSKNAAFFMGSRIKVATRADGEAHVHEMTLSTEDLERKYREGQDVYQSDMLHRRPGDASTLSEDERRLPHAAVWLAGEEGREPEGPPPPFRTLGPHGGSFTRVVISDLKPEILARLAGRGPAEDHGEGICRQLAHLYHYYIHGGKGGGGDRGAGAAPARLPGGHLMPSIVVQHVRVDRQGAAQCRWAYDLRDVTNDLETRYLTAKKSEYPFRLTVQDGDGQRGVVDGVLWYFPFEYDRETMPDETDAPTLEDASQGASGGAGGAGASQGGAPSQGDGRGAEGNGRFFDLTSDDALAGAGAVGRTLQDCPVFETFWQSRLIPGERVASVPFIDAVRGGRQAKDRDQLPDECFRRLRGALFFGPGFRVTRNKLTFRDNLEELLRSAVPGERNEERKFKQWLLRAHADLDKAVEFRGPADEGRQAIARELAGENNTAFTGISLGGGVEAGGREFAVGDCVRTATRPVCVGEVEAFLAPGRGLAGPVFSAQGLVVLSLVPEAVTGGKRVALPLARLERKVTPAERAEYEADQASKAPSELVVLEFSPTPGAPHPPLGEALHFAAGQQLPATYARVLDGNGKELKGKLAGGGTFKVVQNVWFAEGRAGGAPGGAAGTPAKGRKRRAAKAREAAGELVAEHTNSTPDDGRYFFKAVTCDRVGTYRVEYAVELAHAGSPALARSVSITVAGGEPTAVRLAGEGADALERSAVRLGETVPPCAVEFVDDYGNPSRAPESGDVRVEVVAADGAAAPLSAEFERDGWEISGLRVVGGGDDAAVREFVGAPRGRGAAARLRVSVGSLEACSVALSVRAGPPEGLVLLGDEKKYRCPFDGGDGAPRELRVSSGAAVPEIRVQAVDRWGNRTSPGDDLPMSLRARCPLLRQPREAGDGGGDGAPPKRDRPDRGALPAFPFSASGVAAVRGLEAALRAAPSKRDRGGDAAAVEELEDGGAAAPLELWMELDGPAPPELAAVYGDPGPSPAKRQRSAAKEGREAPRIGALEGRVVVAPSRDPARLALVMRAPGTGEDEAIPSEERKNKGTVFLLPPAPVESAVEGLRLVVLDEAGRPVPDKTKGKLTLSWLQTSDGGQGATGKVQIQSGDGSTELPKIRLGDRSGLCCPSLTFVPKKGPALQAFLEVSVLPLDPAKWALTIPDQGQVHAGEVVTAELEAIDRCFNEQFQDPAALPDPEFVVLPNDGVDLVEATRDGPACPPFSIKVLSREWVRKELGTHMLRARMSFAGPLGDFRVGARDRAGPGGASLLEPDELTPTMVPGPPARLIFEGTQKLRRPKKCTLEGLCVLAVDAGGNVCSDWPGEGGPRAELLVEHSAPDASGVAEHAGRAAKVSYKGGRVPFQGGRAQLPDLAVDASKVGFGVYRLDCRLKCAGRPPLALDPASLTLLLEASNAVYKVSIAAGAGLGPVRAGGEARVAVSVSTEDHRPLDEGAEREGLVVLATRRGARKSDVVTLAPAGRDGRHAAFGLDALTQAGEYDLVAQFTETRPEIAAGRKKSENLVRSQAESLVVLPGPPVEAFALSCPEARTCANSGGGGARCVAPAPQFALRDAHGNRLEGPEGGGGAMRAAVAWGRGVSATSDGSVLPELTVGGEALAGGVSAPVAMGPDGLFAFGDFEIVEGTGVFPRPTAASQAPQLEFLLQFEWSPDGGPGGFAPVFEVAVRMRDDSARAAEVQELEEELAALRGEARALSGARDEAREAHEAARGRLAAAKDGVAAAAQDAEAAGVAAPPETPGACAAAVAEAAREAEGGAEGAREHRPAVILAEDRAPSRAKPLMRQAMAAIEQHPGGVEGVEGFLPRLATCEDERVARVICAHTGSNRLMTLVVRDTDARKRAERLLKDRLGRGAFIPDMLPLSTSSSWGARGRSAVPASAPELVRRLHREATAGTDPMLPGLDPPHEAKYVQLIQQRLLDRDAEARLRALCERERVPFVGPGEWPRGLLGHVVNLLRPVKPGLRAEVFYPLLGRSLLFEDIEAAEQYRVLCKTLQTACPDIVCCDGNVCRGSGVVAGSRGRVDTRSPDTCFGSAPRSAGARDLALDALRRLQEALEERDAAAAAEREARGALDDAEARAGARLAAAEAEAEAVAARVRELAARAEGAGAGAAGGADENAEADSPGAPGSAGGRGRGRKRRSGEGVAEDAALEEVGNRRQRKGRRGARLGAMGAEG